MGELPFALAPEAALGAWLREAEREMEPHRTAGTYRGFDGTELPWQAVHADRPRAHVVLLHGFTEFPEKYRELCRYLRQAGCTVWLPVLRGHGRRASCMSTGSRTMCAICLLPAGYRPGAAAAVWPLHGRAAWPHVFCRSCRTALHAPFCARPCSVRRRAARRTGWRSAVRACCCGGASGRKARCFPALMIPTPNFRAAAARAAPVSAPPWTAAQSVLPIRRWARRTAGSMNRLPCAAGPQPARLPQVQVPSCVQRRRDTQVSLREQRLLGRAPAAGAAAGIPRRKARAVQRRKCRIGGVFGRSSGIFRPDGRIRKGRDKMTLLIVIDMQNDFVTGALGTAEAQAIVPHVNAKIAAGGCRRLYTRHPRRGLPCHAGGQGGCPCRTASAAPGAMRWPTA